MPTTKMNPIAARHHRGSTGIHPFLAVSHRSAKGGTSDAPVSKRSVSEGREVATGGILNPAAGCAFSGRDSSSAGGSLRLPATAGSEEPALQVPKDGLGLTWGSA